MNSQYYSNLCSLDKRGFLCHTQTKVQLHDVPINVLGLHSEKKKKGADRAISLPNIVIQDRFSEMEGCSGGTALLFLNGMFLMVASIQKILCASFHVQSA